MYKKIIKFIFVSVISIVGLYFIIIKNIHSLQWYISGILNLLITIFVYNKNRKNKLNKLFSLLGLCLSGYCLLEIGVYLATNPKFAEYWSKIFGISMIYSPAVLFNFTLALIEKEKSMKTLINLNYIISSIFALLNIMGLFVKKFVYTGIKYTPEPTIFYEIFMLNLVLWTLYSIFLLYRNYINTKSYRIKNQLKYVIAGIILAFLFCVMNFLISFKIKIYPLGGLSLVIYTAFIAYAILKYQLMDIEIVIRKGIVYTILTATITGGYILLVGLFYSIFGITVARGSSLIINALFAMIVASVFMPLKNFIQKIVDKLFFKERYDYKEIITGLSQKINSTIELDKLLSLVVDTIDNIFHLDKIFLMLYDEHKQVYKIRYSRNIEKELINTLEVDNNDLTVRWLTKNKRIFNFDYIGAGYNIEGNSKLKTAGTVLSVPLIVSDTMIGILNLGKKLSEELFNNEDLELFQTIGNQSAVAIENAILYSEKRELEKNIYRIDKLVSLGILASSIAHEIKNPIQYLKTSTQTLKMKFDDPAFREKFSSLVPKELDRITSKIDELLNFTKLSRTKFNMVNIKDILENITELMSREMYKHNITIRKNYVDKLPIIIGDEDQLKQVFINIIMNAIDAMPDGGEIFLDTKLENNFVIISIKDTGCGIPKENMDKIFNIFFTTKQNGTGLGLPITKKIITDHSGNIEIESPPKDAEKGTNFIVKLPVERKY